MFYNQYNTIYQFDSAPMPNTCTPYSAIIPYDISPYSASTPYSYDTSPGYSSSSPIDTTCYSNDPLLINSPHLKERKLSDELYLFEETYNLTSDDSHSTTTNEGYLTEEDINKSTNDLNMFNNYQDTIINIFDPITTVRMHVPLTFNGDQNLLLVDKSKVDTPNPTSPIQELNCLDESYYQVVAKKCESPIFENSPSPSNPSYEKYQEVFGNSMSSPLTVACESDSEEINQDSEHEDEEEEIKEESEDEQEEIKEETDDEEEEEKAQRKRKRSDQDTVTKKRRKKVAKSVVYSCHLCEHVSKRKYNLATHIKTHDKKRVKEFKCYQCEKAFDRRHDRNRHMATVHRLERTHVCEHCHASFTRGDALHRHLVQRHGEED